MKKLLLSLTFLSLFFFFVSPAFASSFSDAFTDSDGTALHAHNNLWDCNFNSEAVIQSNRATSSGPNSQTCLANSFQNGSISTLVNFPGSSSQYSSYVALRYQDSNNYYFCNLNANDGFVIFKFYQGNLTVLDNVSGSVGSGDHTLQCSISNSTITLTVDGIQRTQVTDTDLPNAGRGGIQITPNSIVDDYNSIDNDAGPTPTVTPTPTPTPISSFSDTFTDSDGTTLQIHNGLWDCNFNSEAIIQSNRAITSGINFQKCLANSFQDGSVSAILNFPGSNSDNNSAVYLRYIDSNNFYQCNLNASDGYVIFKMYQGNFSVLQNIAGSPGAGNHTILCYITGSTITLSVDGTQRAQTTDMDLPNLGRAGIGLNPNIAVDDYNSINTGIPNSPPSINTIPNETINEGASYSTNGSFTDSDSTSWTATVNYGNGSGTQSLTLSGTSFSLNHVYKDNGIYTVTVFVTDNQGTTGTGTATVTVNNVPPTVGTINAPINPVQVNTAITASASFTDLGVLDTHTAVWNWGDGITSGTVTESNGSGSISDNHAYTAAGAYAVTLTVADKDGGIGTAIFQYVVVYDPSAGFLTGSGSFNSPAGAYIPNPTATGQLKFNIKAKYKGNNVAPTGKIKLDFKKGNFSFDSTSLQWLVINGNKAQLKGTGTINGSGNYTIFISVLDEAKKVGIDKIRIKITDSSSNVIYDNQSGSPETADPTTPVTKGSLKIHH